MQLVRAFATLEKGEKYQRRDRLLDAKGREEERKKSASGYLEEIIGSTCGQGRKGVGQRDVQFVECRTCAFASYSDHMAESGSGLEQPVSSGRVLSRFRGSIRAEPPSFF